MMMMNTMIESYPSPPQWEEPLPSQQQPYTDLLTSSYYYPSPNGSPCLSDYSSMMSQMSSPSLLDMYSIPSGTNTTSTTTTGGAVAYHDMMIPPLDQDACILPPMDYLDQFIQHHEELLTIPMIPNLSTSTSSTTGPSTLKANTTTKKVKKTSVKKKTPKKSKLDHLPIQYNCQHTGCGKSFNRPYNLQSHMKTHTSERPYACSSCGRRFARQHDRNRHEKLHWGIKPYSCSKCKKSFARMDALNRHLKVENGCGSC
ncbi:unnamed protein product [Cunninghamella blakesleeana]